MDDTEQAPPLLDENGRFAKGNKPPAGFKQHPENRHNGSWNKEATPRYKLEKMMLMSEAELRAIVEDSNAPLFEKKLARAIKDGKWREIREMIDQVYGKPQESIDLTSKGEQIGATISFADHPTDSTDSDVS